MLVSPPLPVTTNSPLDWRDSFQTYWDNIVAGSTYLGEGRKRFAITVISSILSQSTVVSSTLSMKLRVCVYHVVWLPNTEQTLPKLQYHRPKIVKYRNIVRHPPPSLAGDCWCWFQIKSNHLGEMLDIWHNYRIAWWSRNLVSSIFIGKFLLYLNIMTFIFTANCLLLLGQTWAISHRLQRKCKIYLFVDRHNILT